MQTPSEIPGVINSDFLKAAVNARREKPISTYNFYKVLDAATKELKMPFDLATRSLNEGFSGGEKKRNEILQMELLKPKLAMLDEIDSGLDVDAIQIVANTIKEEQTKRGFVIVSHYAKLYELIHIDEVYILVNGKVAKVGDKSLINKVDTEGYEWLKDEGIEFPNDEKMSSVSIGSCATKEALKGR